MVGCYGAPAGNNGGGGGGGNSSSYTIGGTVSGLTGSGLVLQDNAGNNLPITKNGAFTFTTALKSGTNFAVTVLTQPSTPAQTCGVSGGAGTASQDITTVLVNCGTGTVTIGGTVTGLVGSGLVLQDNAASNLTITSNGPFTFGTTLATGASYAVTVLTQPTGPAQVCTVGAGMGTANSNVGNVVVTCSTATLSVGGSVSGLDGTGLVLQDNGGSNLTISANGTFTFTSLIASGGAYDVTVLTQPTSPGQTCTVTNASGTTTANVTDIQVICPAVFFPVGGQVVGLVGNGGDMTLQNNGGDNLPITGNGAFTFVTEIAYGGQFDVNLFVGPSTQPQPCVVWGYQGLVTGPVTSILVDCGHNDWSWFNGSQTANATGAADPIPTPPITALDPATPGGRKYPATWVDNSGQLWLFGGNGYDVTSTPQPIYLNDMWVYTGTQNYTGGYNNYWFQAQANELTTSPSPRWGAVTWTDSSGKLWMFGGQEGDTAFLNDLWSYNTVSNTWTRVNPGVPNGSGSYGPKGSFGPLNWPGGRWGATVRLDSAGNLWLFGGFGFDSSTATPGLLNDLWEFNGSEWKWVSGSETVNQDGVYGIQNQANGSNVPGGRQASVSWMDSSNNFYVFGGYNLSPSGNPNAFNDLWKFDGTNWTWLSGSSAVNQKGNYGIEGTPAAGNVPGARWSPAAWIDTAGNLWLFGGEGYDATANGTLGDLWEFSGGQWTWQKGPSSVSQPGVYGLAPGQIIYPHVVNYPGTRWAPGYWVTSNDELWMFGGEGYDSTTASGGIGLLNDLWRYLPYP